MKTWKKYILTSLVVLLVVVAGLVLFALIQHAKSDDWVYSRVENEWTDVVSHYAGVRGKRYIFGVSLCHFGRYKQFMFRESGRLRSLSNVSFARSGSGWGPRVKILAESKQHERHKDKYPSGLHQHESTKIHTRIDKATPQIFKAIVWKQPASIAYNTTSNNSEEARIRAFVESMMSGSKLIILQETSYGTSTISFSLKGSAGPLRKMLEGCGVK